MSEETLQERQDNEIEALKAIFCDDLVDNRQAIAWKVWRPLDLMLTLHPLHSSSVAGSHCSVTLHIKCCENYPNNLRFIIEVNENDDEDEDDDDDEQVQTESEHESDMEIDL
ncbi:unnamed protein product [Plutella xylostella]|uniref:(diamondback moth) hypothetical protein n=1 Tax=Plutella xylostella TaxID=51655 RepID=A0A8S4FIG9_PLUXY|nr:unnamed protein product [Plutella xylostella]